MKRFAVGYESLCRIIMMIVVVNVAFVAHTLPGLMMVFGVAVLIFATMMAVYSWGRLPGMDVHVLEPIGQDQNAGPAGTTTPSMERTISRDRHP